MRARPGNGDLLTEPYSIKQDTATSIKVIYTQTFDINILSQCFNAYTFKNKNGHILYIGVSFSHGVNFSIPRLDPMYFPVSVDFWDIAGLMN